jgi:hypothetical protein
VSQLYAMKRSLAFNTWADIINRADLGMEVMHERNAHNFPLDLALCLRHRLRKDPLESIDSGDKVGKVFKEIFEIEE